MEHGRNAVPLSGQAPAALLQQQGSWGDPAGGLPWSEPASGSQEQNVWDGHYAIPKQPFIFAQPQHPTLVYGQPAMAPQYAMKPVQPYLSPLPLPGTPHDASPSVEAPQVTLGRSIDRARVPNPPRVGAFVKQSFDDPNCDTPLIDANFIYPDPRKVPQPYTLYRKPQTLNPEPNTSPTSGRGCRSSRTRGIRSTTPSTTTWCTSTLSPTLKPQSFTL